jgi:hypothetical protein
MDQKQDGGFMFLELVLYACYPSKSGMIIQKLCFGGHSGLKERLKLK